MPPVPQRWHIYIVALDPRVGTKPGKQRPCLAIQPTEFGEAGLPSTVVLPLTTKVVREDAFPLRVRIPAGVCGLARDSDVLVDQMLAWGQRAVPTGSWSCARSGAGCGSARAA